jgi:hypothetical protein
VSDAAWLIILILALVVFLAIVVAIVVTWAPPWLKRLTGWVADLWTFWPFR